MTKRETETDSAPRTRAMATLRRTPVLVIAAATGSLLASCQGETSEPLPPGVGPGLDDVALCRIYLSYKEHGALCTARPQHREPRYDEILLPRLQCRKGTPEQQWAQALLEAIGEGRVALDWEQGLRCLEKSRELRTIRPGLELATSPEWINLRDGACHVFVTGRRGEDEACVDDWDCPEGTKCFSDKPTEPGSRRCRAPARVGESCSRSFHPCERGCRCVDGRCQMLTGPGGSCTSNEMCLSGLCSGSPRVCAPMRVAQLLGAPCTADADCLDPCARCLVPVGAETKQCTRPGVEGTICAQRRECAQDLGCQEGVCAEPGLLATCGPQLDLACGPPLSCTPGERCAPFDTDPPRCEASPYCAYEESHRRCRLALGFCLDPPASGRCLFDHACGEGAYCRDATNTCEEAAEPGESCSATSEMGPGCADPYACVQGRCEIPCRLVQDCAPGGRCDLGRQPPQCVPLDVTRCREDQDCPSGHFCSLCRLFDQALCNAAHCEFATTPQCETGFVCADHDGDPEGCRAEAVCAFDPLTSYCDPGPLCGSFYEDPKACTEQPGCTYRKEPACRSRWGNAYVGACRPRLDAGERCRIATWHTEIGTSSMCASGFAGKDESGSGVCTVTPWRSIEGSVSPRNTALLRQIFLLGSLP